MARICREAGARVKENQLLRDLNIVAPADDQRRIEVIVNSLQVAIDTTVVSALTGRGVARGRRQGQAIHQVEQDKHRGFSELLTGTRCHFLMMAFDVAGRWSPSAAEFGLVQVSLLAQRSSPFNPTPVLPALDSFAGMLHPASVRCQLAGEASGNMRWCERAGGARGRFGTAFYAREGVTPSCWARVGRLG